MIRRPPGSALFPCPTLSGSLGFEPGTMEIDMGCLVWLAPDSARYDQENLAALTILVTPTRARGEPPREGSSRWCRRWQTDPKITRLNSTQPVTSYAVFSLKT